MSEIPMPGVTRTEGVCGGRPCIAGTRIRVTDIVMSVRYEERSLDQIAADLVITVEQVGAALDYYRENSEEIEADIERQIETFERLSKASYGRPVDTLLPR